jgi:hypothetical protein
MAEDGAFAAGQDRRLFIAEPRVPDRVNPAMNALDEGGMNTPVNCAVAFLPHVRA